MYFDHTQAGMVAQNVQESYYDPFRTDLVVGNAPLSNPAAGMVITPFAVVTPVALSTSDRFVAPRWQQWNVGMQRRLYSRGMIDVGYLGSRGDHLLWYVDINQPQPDDVLAQDGRAQPGAALSGLRRDHHARDDSHEPVSRARDELSS